MAYTPNFSSKFVQINKGIYRGLGSLMNPGYMDDESYNYIPKPYGVVTRPGFNMRLSMDIATAEIDRLFPIAQIPGQHAWGQRSIIGFGQTGNTTIIVFYIRTVLGLNPRNDDPARMHRIAYVHITGDLAANNTVVSSLGSFAPYIAQDAVLAYDRFDLFYDPHDLSHEWLQLSFIHGCWIGTFTQAYFLLPDRSANAAGIPFIRPVNVFPIFIIPTAINVAGLQPFDPNDRNLILGQDKISFGFHNFVNGIVVGDNWETTIWATPFPHLVNMYRDISPFFLVGGSTGVGTILVWSGSRNSMDILYNKRVLSETVFRTMDNIRTDVVLVAVANIGIETPYSHRDTTLRGGVAWWKGCTFFLRE